MGLWCVSLSGQKQQCLLVILNEATVSPCQGKSMDEWAKEAKV